MRYLFAFLITTLSLAPCSARTWTSADGQKTIEGEYISHTDEHVVIKRSGKELVVKFEFLSASDKQWVEDLAKKSDADESSSSEDAASVKTLLTLVRHGDDESTVISKLEKNPHVEAPLSKTFLARVGLNGFFKTKQKLKGQDYEYYFDWDGNNQLACITLRSEEFPRAEFEQGVKNAWMAGNEIVAQSYGEAKQSSDFPPVTALTPEANLMITHVWHPEGTNKTVALCVGIEEDKAFVTVNYYNQVIELQKL